MEFHENIKGKKTGKEMCHALYDFLMKLNIEEKTQALIQVFKEENLLDKVNEYRQIWDAIVDIMDQIAEVINEDKIDSEVFGRILKSGFEEYELGLIPPAIDQILVSSVQRIRSHDIKALYIVGVNDGVFPGAIADEGILTDLERESLRENGLELAKDTKSLAF
ncbi:ATP-dependent helicase/deoxyribonuclease subunit B [bioreactor metagenome]|uniref:ATP-dependent helicase/deoxyribonuclease subunit B n=2 Tax=root TaxID=1 RepID=A0A645E640_9ZZZZ